MVVLLIFIKFFAFFKSTFSSSAYTETFIISLAPSFSALLSKLCRYLLYSYMEVF